MGKKKHKKAGGRRASGRAQAATARKLDSVAPEAAPEHAPIESAMRPKALTRSEPPPPTVPEVVEAIVEQLAPPLFEGVETRAESASGVHAIPPPPGPDAATDEPQRAPHHGPHPGSISPRGEHRAHARIALAVEIGLETESHFFSGLSGDVSEGGVFVQTYRNLAVGSPVDLEFDLPNGHVSAHGHVRWHRSKSESAPPGVGIAFDELDAQDRELIHAFCEARAPLYYDVEHA